MNNVLTYTIQLFNNSNDEDFLKSLDIYRNNIIRQEKTPLNEISWVVDNSKNFKKSKPHIFGLKLNKKIIGYAETAYIISSKVIIIDYLLLDSKYSTHSAFYSFLLLIINFFNEKKLDYDYVITEKLVYDDNCFIDEMSEWQLEGFKVINQLYVQPKLEVNNCDSEHEAILLLYQRNTDNPYISKDSYKDIVKSIYFDYYYEWDSFFFNDNESVENFNKLKENFEKIEKSVTETEIKLNGYPFKKLSNDTKIIPKTLNSDRNIWKSLLFVAVFFTLALAIILAIKKMNVELIIVGVIFVLMLFIWLAVLSMSNEKALKILDKIPFLAKFFGRSK